MARLWHSVRFVDTDRLKRPGGKWRTALESLTLPDCYTIRCLQSPASWRAIATVAAHEKYALVRFDTLGLAPVSPVVRRPPAGCRALRLRQDCAAAERLVRVGGRAWRTVA
jgi:hypothetical protein